MGWYEGMKRGNIVIDYIIGDIGVKDRIKRMAVGDRMDSDHHPVEVWLEGNGKKKRNRGDNRKCWRDLE